MNQPQATVGRRKRRRNEQQSEFRLGGSLKKIMSGSKFCREEELTRSLLLELAKTQKQIFETRCPRTGPTMLGLGKRLQVFMNNRRTCVDIELTRDILMAWARDQNEVEDVETVTIAVQTLAGAAFVLRVLFFKLRRLMSAAGRGGVLRAHHSNHLDAGILILG